jgi:serine/threonine protein kinase
VRGVQHAHQKAIIHRDLEPPNILVMEDDLVPPLNRLGMIDAYNGHLPEAHAEIRRAEQIARLPYHGVLLDQVLLNVADLALRDGDGEHSAAALAEAHQLLEAAFTLAEHQAETWRYALWDSVHSLFLAQQGDLTTARLAMAAALPTISQRFGPGAFYSLLAHRREQPVEAQVVSRAARH